MAAGEALDIMEQIHALVSDRLQVVSYKWLSRNFSIASDDAKRLLQNFVQKHGNELEVVYALSGWLKDDPHSYHVKLVPAVILSDAKGKFKENFSIQVYSVQACIPNDPAVLWNSEFVQSEQLFDQPTAIDNCLRDNRFCTIANSFVKRDIEGKCGVSSAVPKSQIGASVGSKISSSFFNLSAQLHQEEKHRPISNSAAQTSTDIHNEGKNALGVSNKLNLDKQTKTVIPTLKLKAETDKLSVNGGSLASLWGCTKTKKRQSSPIKESITDAPICTTAMGVNTFSANDFPSDEKMEQNCNAGRKRKVVLDFSDDDVENDVVSLASPGPTTRFSDPDNEGSNGNAPSKAEHVISAEQYTINCEAEHERKETDALCLSAAPEAGNVSNIDATAISAKRQSHTSAKSADKGEVVSKPHPSSPQRKKVLKTRIDERGREVTEVVWEEKDVDGGTDNNTGCNMPVNRLPVTNKETTSATSAPSNPAGKAGNKKNAKGGKDVKQGNIMSFFKKI